MLTVVVQMLIVVIQYFRGVDFCRCWRGASHSKIAFLVQRCCFLGTMEPEIVGTAYHFKVTQLTSPAGPNGGKFDPELANRKEPSTAS